MGVKERKEREKVEMREKILQSAHKLFLDRGFDEISIRNIAEAIEYSPATIYLYFRDKNEIIHALHQDGFRLLNEHFQPLLNIASGFERLKAMGKAYIKFATSNPSVYELIFMKSEPMEHLANCKQDEWMEGDRSFDVLVKTVQQCQSEGYFLNLDAYNFSMMIWSFIHGLCSLRISGHLGHVREIRESNVALDTVMNTTYETFKETLERLKG